MQLCITVTGICLSPAYLHLSNYKCIFIHVHKNMFLCKKDWRWLQECVIPLFHFHQNPHKLILRLCKQKGWKWFRSIQAKMAAQDAFSVQSWCYCGKRKGEREKEKGKELFQYSKCPQPSASFKLLRFTYRPVIIKLQATADLPRCGNSNLLNRTIAISCQVHLYYNSPRQNTCTELNETGH